MSLHPRIAFVVILGLLAMAAAVSPAIASGGVHILVIKEQTEGSWLVEEYIDNSLIDQGSVVDGDLQLIKPGVVLTSEASSESITILRARSEYLFVFTSDNLERLESRISQVEQDVEKIKLEDELRQQLLKAMFQIPVWPFLAASEVPGKAIDIKREDVLPYSRDDFFPVALFAGVGDVSGWDVVGFDQDGAKLKRSNNVGEGSGILFEYILKGSLGNIEITTSGDSTIEALYIQNNTDWQITGSKSMPVSTKELVGLAGSKAATVSEKILKISSVRIQDKAGWVERYLAYPSIASLTGPLRWSQKSDLITAGTTSSGETLSFSAKLPAWKFSVAMICCWVAFGLVVIIANWLYRFSSSNPVHLLTVSMVVYFPFLLISLLAGGLWGLGFIPAAALGSRFISDEGRRISGFGAILGASFILLMLSALFSH
jgi:hypothetical protein